MLEVKELYVSYGELEVLRNVNISVKEGELVAIIGSNGAGKTTLLKTIAGLVKARKGKILHSMDGVRDITNLPPHVRVNLGMVYVPEGRHVFPYLTVKENLELGAYNLRARDKANENLKIVYELFPRLKERENQQAITLSGGEQQMLAIARGLMSAPKLLMLDEPSLGLAPKLVHEIFEVISELHKRGITILLVEQNARQALELSDRAYVLENGRVTLCDSSKNLLHDERVKKAYLGL